MKTKEGRRMSIYEKRLRPQVVLVWTLGLATVSSSVNCAGDASDTNEGSGRTGSGVEGSKTLGELDRAEAEALCFDVETAFSGEDLWRGLCVLGVQEVTDQVSDCEVAVEQCLEEIESSEASTGPDSGTCVDELLLADCDVTVEELESCMNDQLEAYRAIGRGGCKDAVGVNPETLQSFVEPASCERLADRCPEFYSGSSGASEGPGAGFTASISGELDGEIIQLTSDGFAGGGGGTEDDWLVEMGFDEAHVRLWGQNGETHGLLFMPDAAVFGSEWLCLSDVQLEPDQAPFSAGTWQSNEVSSLGACAQGEGAPLELDMTGTRVEGTFGGEAISWTRGSHSCFGSECSYVLYDDDREWHLVLGAADGGAFNATGTTEIAYAALLDTEGSGAVACGSTGTASETGSLLSVRVDSLGEFVSCPGEPLDGQLTGTF